MELQDDLFHIVKDVNDAWLSSNWSVLERYFHENVVMTMPGLGQQLDGKSALVQSYKDFVTNAKIEDFQQKNPVVNSWDKVAMITYEFEITYTEGGKPAHDVGTEMFLFAREKKAWKIIWRTMAIKAPEGTDSPQR
ncbi:MAG TPA: nuclear transport factor 2 family protein [Candidatus Lokiarchaeia archaeon]|nr:nuclear transport factor 2 family protein [Candidatus Lokiarchaeia archaeon]